MDDVTANERLPSAVANKVGFHVERCQELIELVWPSGLYANLFVREESENIKLLTVNSG